jgi:hypothetical protein
MLNHSLVPVGSTGYDIDNSLRFNDNDSAYLSRTFSAGNRRTYTLSTWMKKGNASTGVIFSGETNVSGNYFVQYMLEANGVLSIIEYNGASPGWGVVTSSRLRDPSAWYHLVFAFDTTQATSSNRIKIYVNGEQQTVVSRGGSYSGFPALNGQYDINANAIHSIGRRKTATYFDGYLAEVNFVDGTAELPSAFGETDEDYGHWKPKKYTGTYGTNGFYLPMKDTSLISAIGGDSTGTDGDYKYHIFSTVGTATFTVDSISTGSSVEYLVIAGGGGGGGNTSASGGGGGGAGGYLTGALSVSAQAYTITVGAGGASETSGSNSIFSSITSTGGGYGAFGSAGAAGGNGGSGGGGSRNACSAGGTGTSGQGFDGAGGCTDGGLTSGDGFGGGGGAGGRGLGSPSGVAGGAGGVGSASSITGSSIFRAGGGGGGGYASASGGAGGNAGGGRGANGQSENGTAGTANSGGGGGGGGDQSAGAGSLGGAGGSGVVIIRY